MSFIGASTMESSIMDDQEKLFSLILEIVESESDDFSDLLKLSGLNIETDFSNVDLSDLDFGDFDISSIDTGGSKLNRRQLILSRAFGSGWRSVTAPTSKQCTLKSEIGCSGIGLHSGSPTSVLLRPAPPNTGIIFRRIDVEENNEIPAFIDNVIDPSLSTKLENLAGVSVSTIEHLLAALWGTGIDNAFVDVDGSEIPIMDGSSAPFVFLVECAGAVEQEDPRQVIEILTGIEIKDGEKSVSLSPYNGYLFDVYNDFSQYIPSQRLIIELDLAAFKSEICRARTFGFVTEVEALRAHGMGRGGSLDNAVIIGEGGDVLNKEGLRYEDELIRHKTADAIGDLYLAGHRILGKYTSVGGGSSLNNELVRELVNHPNNWRTREEPLTFYTDSIPGGAASGNRGNIVA